MLNSLKSLVDTDILSLLTPKRQLVGLDIGSSGIKLVQLKENRGRYILQKFGFKPLEPEVNIDFHVLPAAGGEASDGEMSVILVAAKKDKINELTELVKGAGLMPMVMDVDAFAIENMHAINYPMSQDETTALVNVGASVMNINIVSKGTSLFTRDIPIGGNRYTESIQRELGLSYEDAEALKKGGKTSGS